MSQMGNWKVRKSQQVFNTKFFNIRADECEVSDGRLTSPYYVVEVSDWVNVVPITKEGQVILIKQYRHAVNEICWEIPGGAIDTHKGESPKDAALRELFEETGFVPGRIEFLGRHHPNPALQSNWMYSFIAYDCQLKDSQHLDEFEEIEVVTKSIKEMVDMVYRGEIQHSIILASIFLSMKAMGFHY